MFDMDKVQEFVDKLVLDSEKALMADSATYLFYSPLNVQDRMKQNRERFESIPNQIRVVRDLISGATVKVGEPRIYKNRRRDSIKIGDIYFVPVVWIVSGEMRVTVNNKARIDSSDYVVDQSRERPPTIFRESGIVSYLESSEDEETLWNFIIDGLRDKWESLRQEIEEEIDAQISHAPDIIKRFYDKNGDQVRKKFKEKMIKRLENCHEIADKSAVFVYELMKLNIGEVNILLSFVNRNKSDMKLIDVDDVDDVLKLVSIGGVINS